MVPMTNAPRPVAVLAGNRIPFARSDSFYAHASNHDMLTAALEGLVSRAHLQGELLGEVVAGAVLKHSRDRDLTREACSSTALAPETPAYDIQQACATGLEAVDRRRQQDRPRPDRRGHRGRRRHDLRCADRAERGPASSAARSQPGTLDLGPPASARRACDRARSSRRSPATRSPARASRWGSTARSWPRNGGSAARRRMRLPPAATSAWPPPMSVGSSRTCSRRYLGLERDQNLRPDSTPGAARHAPRGVRGRATAR